MIRSKRNCFISFWVVVAFFSIVLARTVFAYPALQLDIENGWYDPSTETIVASDSSFTLYALLDPSQLPANEDYYISAAILPKLADGEDLSGSSFSFDGTLIKVTEDMTYGVPPVESLQEKDAGDLPLHSVSPNYFSEVPFVFVSSNKALVYNTQDNPGGFVADPNGGFLYAAFVVDVSGLDPGYVGYVVHFDLYDTIARNTKNPEDIDTKHFAPFSHDAESLPIPEPSTLLFLGSGLIVWGRLKKKKNKMNKATNTGSLL